jgi:hypothetical protein
LLKHFGPRLNAEALAGDLLEEFREGRTHAWYWRQVLAAIRWRRLLFTVLPAGGYAWYLVRFSTLRPLAAIVVTAALLASAYLPGMLSTAQRIAVGIALLISAVLIFFYLPGFRDGYWIVIPMIAGNVVFYREYQPPPSFKMTWRELLLGDPQAERTRLISQLERTMSEETDPERRQAYASSLAALRLNSGNSRQCGKES